MAAAAVAQASRAFVRRMQNGSVAEQERAVAALSQAFGSYPASQPASVAVMAECGVIPPLLQLIGSRGEHLAASRACVLLANLALESPERCRAIIRGGGGARLEGCLANSGLPAVQAPAAAALANLANGYGGGDAGAAAVAAVCLPSAVR